MREAMPQVNRMLKSCNQTMETLLFRTQCPVAYSECVATEHEATCECKEEFHGNGSVACIPDGFVEKSNGEKIEITKLYS